jgi:hypothetical protein
LALLPTKRTLSSTKQGRVCTGSAYNNIDTENKLSLKWRGWMSHGRLSSTRRKNEFEKAASVVVAGKGFLKVKYSSETSAVDRAAGERKLGRSLDEHNSYDAM